MKIQDRRYVVPSLFDDQDALEREHCLMETIDRINALYGRGSLRMGICSDEIKATRKLQSPHYSTRLEDFPKVT